MTAIEEKAKPPALTGLARMAADYAAGKLGPVVDRTKPQKPARKYAKRKWQR